MGKKTRNLFRAVRLSPHEDEILAGRLKAAGFDSVSEFLRHVIVTGRVPHKPLKER